MWFPNEELNNILTYASHIGRSMRHIWGRLLNFIWYVSSHLFCSQIFHYTIITIFNGVCILNPQFNSKRVVFGLFVVSWLGTQWWLVSHRMMFLVQESPAVSFPFIVKSYVCRTSQLYCSEKNHRFFCCCSNHNDQLWCFQGQNHLSSTRGLAKTHFTFGEKQPIFHWKGVLKCESTPCSDHAHTHLLEDGKIGNMRWSLDYENH